MKKCLVRSCNTIKGGARARGLAHALTGQAMLPRLAVIQEVA